MGLPGKLMRVKQRMLTTKRLGLFAVIAAIAIVSCLPAPAQNPKATSPAPGTWAVYTYEPTAKRIVYTAARSLGMLRGVQEEDALTTLFFTGTGTMYTVEKSSNWPAVKLDKYTVELSNYQDRGMRVDIVSGGHRQVQVVAGKYAWDENDVSMDGPPVGKSQTAVPAAVQQRQVLISIMPFDVIRAAHQNLDKVTVTPLEHGTFALAFPYQGDTMKVTLDRNRRPVKVELGIDHPVLGKTTLEADYSGYQDYEGRGVSFAFFPGRIIQKLGGHTVLDVQVSHCTCINPYVIFPIPESLEKAGATAAPPATSAREVGEIWLPRWKEFEFLLHQNI